jgi:hypothetical protein
LCLPVYVVLDGAVAVVTADGRADWELLAAMVRPLSEGAPAASPRL